MAHYTDTRFVFLDAVVLWVLQRHLWILYFYVYLRRLRPSSSIPSFQGKFQGPSLNGTPIPIHLPYHSLKIPWSMGNGMGPAYGARGLWSPQFHGPMRLRGYFQPWILGFWPASSWPLLSPEDPYFMQAAGSLNSPGTFLVKKPTMTENDGEYWIYGGSVGQDEYLLFVWCLEGQGQLLLMTSYVLPLRVDDTSLAYLYC